jgi:non-specific serine/threonine protein kinase
LGDPLSLSASLEVLAWVAAAEGDHRRAARLLGASEQQAWVSGGNPFHAGVFGPVHDQCETRARSALGDARFEAEFGSGAALTLEQAIAYAEGDDDRSRKPQHPPAAPPPDQGLSELTRREWEIAQLIAEGMTNKQIAHRLLISRRTAEGHVEHILAKLGFSTRTQIASWMLTQHLRTAHRAGGDPPPG